MTMTTFGSKLFEKFRNLKSDAVPRAPRRETKEPVIEDVTDDNENNVDTSYEPEEIKIDLDDIKTDEKSKSSSNTKKKNTFSFIKPEKNGNGDKSTYNVNTQATGSVVHIMNSKGVHYGNVFVNNFGPNNGNSTDGFNSNGTSKKECVIEKTNLITLLMEAKIKLEHEYIDYVSKNLGKNWHDFFMSLGYTKGRIETFEYDEAKRGVASARYKLLLDWSRNDDDGTLGRLATLLWEEGERQIVKEMSIIYKNSKK